MASIITMLCFLLFVAYSISLFIRHQSYMVALANFIANGGLTDVAYDTPSSVWIAALLGTALSIIPALFLLHSFHFPICMKGMAFIPSYVVLGLMTGICPQSVDAVENDIPILRAAILLLVSAMGILYSQVYHEDRGEHAPFSNYLGSNVLQVCVGIMFCISLTNSDRQLHLQQPLAQTIHRHDYTLANSIVPGATTTNNTIASLRVLALSKQGLMADRLFSIHGMYGSRCLLPDTFLSAQIYHTTRLVYNHLQAIPVNFDGDVTSFLQKAVERRMMVLQDSAVTHVDSLRARPLMDYYLCALLLDRDLPSFAKSLPRFYAQEAALPRHYREALAVYYAEDSLATRFASDAIMDSIYRDYTTLRCSFQDRPMAQRKACAEAFPSTYWNYYFFPEDRKQH